MRKPKPIFHKIIDDHYKATIFLTSKCTLDVLSDILMDIGIGAELGKGNDLGGCYFQLEKEGSAVHLIWLPDWNNSHDDIANLVHEVGHAAFSILCAVDKKVKYTFMNSEQHCYYTAWLFKACMDALNNNKKGKK